MDSHFEEICNFVKKDALTDAEIASRLNCSEELVRRFRIKHNIERPNKRFSQLFDLSDNDLEILLGVLLGDGSLVKRSNYSAYFTCSHSIKQKFYVDHLKKALTSFYLRSSSRNGKYPQVGIASKSSPTFKKLYDIFYPNGKKVIPTAIFDKFTAKSLTYLFMDDGYRIKSTSKGEVCSVGIALCAFSDLDLQTFCNFLEEKFNLHFTIQYHYNKYYDKYYPDIVLKRTDFSRFKELINPYLLSEFIFKIKCDS